MINTKLHNSLIEKEITNKLLESDKINQKAKTALMKEKLKSTLLIIGVIFIVLLMLIFLYWIFPNKQYTMNTTKIEKLMKQYSKKCNCAEKSKEKVQPKDAKQTIKTNTKNNVQNKDSSGELKNGTEYIKHDNHVYKRTWEEGVLIEDIQLEKTIKESRDTTNENIPQLATPNSGNIKK